MENFIFCAVIILLAQLIPWLNPNAQFTKINTGMKSFCVNYDAGCTENKWNTNNYNQSLTLFRMGFFSAVHGWGRGKKAPLPKICHTYPTMRKLGTVIPYL